MDRPKHAPHHVDQLSRQIRREFAHAFDGGVNLQVVQGLGQELVDVNLGNGRYGQYQVLKWVAKF